VSEVANLKVSDIDSERMTLKVEQAKGQRDRYVMLSSPHAECRNSATASDARLVGST
jgi:site-specific recombinase XerD